MMQIDNNNSKKKAQKIAQKIAEDGDKIEILSNMNIDYDCMYNIRRHITSKIIIFLLNVTHLTNRDEK